MAYDIYIWRVSHKKQKKPVPPLPKGFQFRTNHLPGQPESILPSGHNPADKMLVCAKLLAPRFYGKWGVDESSRKPRISEVLCNAALRETRGYD